VLAHASGQSKLPKTGKLLGLHASNAQIVRNS
jgi:hypothetical protein